MAGLLHDAAEAYLSDIPSPIKRHLPDYNAMEKKVQDVINEKFGVDTYDELIKIADKDATSNEAFYLLDSKGRDWNSVLFQPNKKYKPHCLTPADSYQLFMSWFTELSKSPILLAA